MAITYPLTLPANPGFETIVVRRNSVVGVNPSPYTGAQQTYVFPGQWWEADVAVAVLNKADTAAWEAFSAKLNGREGTFLLGDPLRQTPRGSAAGAPGTPLVDGAHAAAVNEVDLKGLPASADGYLLAGDYIQFGSGSGARLHQLLEDLDSDGAGLGTALIWPRTRAALADEAAVTVAACQGVFRMAQNEHSFARRRGPFTNYGFTCAEAL